MIHSRREGLRSHPVPVINNNQRDDIEESCKDESTSENEDHSSPDDEYQNIFDEKQLESTNNEPVIKARVLSHNGTGQDIYGFKTPKRKEAMVKAAEESVHSAKRSGKKTKKMTKESQRKAAQKTPNQNNGVKSRKMTVPKIVTLNLANNECESSEHESDESNSAEEPEEDENRDDSNNENQESDLLDEYFQVHDSKFKLVTSDKTLSNLKKPKMNQTELLKHLKDAESTHIKETLQLHKNLLSYFDKWMFQLLSGFNIMIYGLGSKHKLLEQFHTRFFNKCAHIVINGYFPNISIKQIVNLITDDLLNRGTTFKNVTDQCMFIKREFDQERSDRLFLVIHNIDGCMLRSQATQAALACLSSAKNIHVIASIDHINAPLIWDQNCASKFNWVWYDCTTFEPYQEETSYENSMLVHQSGTLALSSLTHVLRSLTPNAKGIFNLLCQHLLDNETNSTYQGLSFSDLYSRCRERFLVNSDLTLRAQLTEFKDHKLVKIKKGFDGVEYLSVAVDCATIRQYLDNAN